MTHVNTTSYGQAVWYHDGTEAPKVNYRPAQCHRLRGIVEFTVPGKPQRWQRTGGNGRRRWKTETQRDAEAAIRTAFARAQPTSFEPFGGSIVITCFADFKTPKSGWIGKACHGGQKPDDDNIGKLYREALAGLAYGNDAQVSGGPTWKDFAKAEQVLCRVEFYECKPKPKKRNDKGNDITHDQ